MNIKNMRERFEANMLDGDSVDDCGGCMLNAKEVLEYFKEDLEQEIKKEREDIIKIVESMRVDWDNEMVNTIDWKDANDWTIDNIINKIKNKYDKQ